MYINSLHNQFTEVKFHSRFLLHKIGHIGNKIKFKPSFYLYQYHLNINYILLIF